MTTTTLNQLGSGATTETVVGYGICCLVCGLQFDTYPDPAEAGYLAAVHDELHHRGRQEATITVIDTSGVVS